MFVGDQNALCAGRDPGEPERALIRSADAVILPQGCRRSLFEMAAAGCPHVFPDYTARFRYPDKIGQIRLFRETGTPHPPTWTYEDLGVYRPGSESSDPPPGYPCVVKFAWGGEGETVFHVETPSRFQEVLGRVRAFEKTGQRGFLIQAHVPGGRRTLRVAVIGRRRIAYWRIQPDPGAFAANISRGAVLDPDADPHLRRAGISLADDFARRTRIDLAGLDILFGAGGQPLLLEINYFFGRRGLGGSDAFYGILEAEIRQWLHALSVRASDGSALSGAGVPAPISPETGPETGRIDG